MDSDISSISFLAMIDDTNSAMKIAGNKNGGKLILAVDDTQLPELLKAVLLREQLLKVTISVVDE